MEDTIIKSYKGFNKNLQCRDFQYEIGKKYKIGGDIKVCEYGFHACENPFEVFAYYNMVDSRFCEVEQSGLIDKEKNSTKMCSSKIKIIAELNLDDMIKSGVKWLNDAASLSKNHNNTDSRNISNNCDYETVSNTGYYVQISNSGVGAIIINTGIRAKISSNGNFTQICNVGNYARINSNGDYTQIYSSGEKTIICCTGHNSAVRAKVGSWITLSEWKYNAVKHCDVSVYIKTEYVDGKRIKADTWYKLIDGKFKEV